MATFDNVRYLKNLKSGKILRLIRVQIVKIENHNNKTTVIIYTVACNYVA